MSDSAPRSLRLEAMLLGPAEEAEPEGARPMLVFERGGMLYALDAASIEVIVPRRSVTPLPFAPNRLRGVASVRGRMRLVVDPPGRADGGSESFTRLIALHGDAQLAVVADHVFGVRSIDPTEVYPAEGEGPTAGSVRLGADTAVILDPERLIAIETTR